MSATRSPTRGGPAAQPGRDPLEPTKLRRRRRALGLTQAELAERLAVSRPEEAPQSCVCSISRCCPTSQRVNPSRSASTPLNRGAGLSQVQDVLGHADRGTTNSVYTHSTPWELRAVVLLYRASAAEYEAEEARRRTVVSAAHTPWICR